MESKKVKEIKKGLECCNNSCAGCIGCPYERYRLKCTDDLTKDALTLINELGNEKKQVLKDCTASKKIGEEIGYKNGKKDTATKILTYLKNRQLVGKYELNKLAEKYGVDIKE